MPNRARSGRLPPGGRTTAAALDLDPKSSVLGLGLRGLGLRGLGFEFLGCRAVAKVLKSWHHIVQVTVTSFCYEIAELTRTSVTITTW